MKTPILKPLPFAKSLHISPRLNAAYINNPKVACSTIKLTLQQTELGDPAYTPKTSVHSHEDSPLLTWPDIEPGEDPLKGLFVFSFVRNPYSRLRSVYLNKIVHPQKRGAFREQAGFAASETPSFHDFVIAVCDQRPHKQNPHWRLQALNLSIGRIEFDFIGRLEAFDTDWEKLCAYLPLPAAPTNAGKPSSQKDAASLTFTSDMIDAVQSAYAADFEAFHYNSTPD